MYKIHLLDNGHKYWEYADLAGIRATVFARDWNYGGYRTITTIVADTVDEAETALIQAALDYYSDNDNSGAELLVGHPEIDPGSGISYREVNQGRDRGSIYAW